MKFLSPRRLGSRAVVALAAAVALTACSSGSGDNSNGSPTGDFERRDRARTGTAEIDAQPERVVTLGMGSAETAIALGVTPVGMEEYPWGSDETGYLPGSTRN